MADTLSDQEALERAFRMLARRPHSEREIQRKLKEKGASGAGIARVLDRLRELGYVDDAAFARGWAKGRAGGRLWGDRRIAAGLREKGIPAELIRTTLSEIREDVDEGEALRRCLERKLRGRDPAALELREKRRLAQSLAGRGFPLDLIVRELNAGEGRSVKG
ncbi:MAG: recombination regulator RecX [Syntrophales bacterium]|nr:recombination regulator RecX [Syntrophales bacterium]MDD4338093.1 regulatory protein RecX [Syntrophales bacterium]HOG06615.1 regulatory protein RecX [Syntrophales bacterium]HOS78318.1 regulatory protein RecX [Syntrophales bacterium]HPB69391.1 regulatory protein RecX [Syntrophales bacterium]